MPKHDITTMLIFFRPLVCQTDTCTLYQKNYDLISDMLCNVHCEIEEYFENASDDLDIEPCHGCDCDGNFGSVYPFLLDGNSSNHPYKMCIRFSQKMIETCLNLIKSIQEDKPEHKQVILATDAAFDFADDFVAQKNGNFVKGDSETGWDVEMQGNHDERNKVVEIDAKGIRFCMDITSKTHSQAAAVHLQSMTYTITDLLAILDKVQNYISRPVDTFEEVESEDTQE